MRSAMERREAIRRPRTSGAVLHTGSDSGILRLVVRTGSGVALLAVNEIDHLEADGNLVVVHSGTQQYRIRVPLSVLLDRLARFGFVRIHRCTVVRLAAILRIEKGEYRKAVAVLRGGARLEIGRAEFHRLRALWQPGLLDLGELSTTLHLLDEVLAGA